MKLVELKAAQSALLSNNAPADIACMSDADARELFRDAGVERNAKRGHRAIPQSPAGYRWAGSVAGIEIFVPE